jgi:hypothetical protein
VSLHDVEAAMDPLGTVKVWYVVVDGVIIWSSAPAIEGPADALSLWTALSMALE